MGSVIVDGSAAVLLPTTSTLTALANVVLLRIGAKNQITSITDGSPNALKLNATWEFVRDEVLQAKNWKFAKTRVALSASVTAPVYGYNYAYPLPVDFLSLVKTKMTPGGMRNPAALSDSWGGIPDARFYPQGLSYDPPVYPPGFPYVLEALPSGVLCLMSNYDNAAGDMAINYIRKVTDLSLYPPGFKNCLIYRWAMELAQAITESLQKMQAMKILYEQALISTESLNESQDYLENETGNASWASAGR
jgi:hypothetical protein